MAKIGRRKGLVILVSGVVAAIALLFLINWEREKEGYPLKEEKEVFLSEAQEVNLVGWNEEGEKSWKLEADSGVQFSDRTVLSGVNLYLLEKEEPISSVEAKEIIMDNRSSNLLFKGDVKVISCLDGAELLTSELEWAASERKLRAQNEVIIKRKNLVVEGWGFVANPDLSQIEIEREIVTRFVTESD